MSDLDAAELELFVIAITSPIWGTLWVAWCGWCAIQDWRGDRG